MTCHAQQAISKTDREEESVFAVRCVFIWRSSPAGNVGNVGNVGNAQTGERTETEQGALHRKRPALITPRPHCTMARAAPRGNAVAVGRYSWSAHLVSTGNAARADALA